MLRAFICHSALRPTRRSKTVLPERTPGAVARLLRPHAPGEVTASLARMTTVNLERCTPLLRSGHGEDRCLTAATGGGPAQGPPTTGASMVPDKILISLGDACPLVRTFGER